MNHNRISDVYSKATIVIDNFQGQWQLLSRTPEENCEQSLEEFCAALADEASKQYRPRILFRHTWMIDEFLQVDNTQLDSLQDYVREVSKTKNLVVNSAEEVLKILRVPPEQCSLYEYDWIFAFNTAEVPTGDSIVHPMHDLDPRNYTESVPPEEHSARAGIHDYQFQRYLQECDKVCQILLGKDTDGIPVSAGRWTETCLDTSLYGEDFTSLIFIPDDQASPPYRVISSYYKFEEPGQLHPVMITTSPRVVKESKKMSRTLPLDVAAAKTDSSTKWAG